MVVSSNNKILLPDFIKSFILPYFDNCSTLIIYFPKYLIQKTPYVLLHLFGFSFRKKSADEVELL